MSRGGKVSKLQVGDSFGPISGDPRGSVELVVADVFHAGLRGAGGGVRNLWDVVDQYGRVWRTGGNRFSDDCYGWELL